MLLANFRERIKRSTGLNRQPLPGQTVGPLVYNRYIMRHKAMDGLMRLVNDGLATPQQIGDWMGLLPEWFKPSEDTIFFYRGPLDVIRALTIVAGLRGTDIQLTISGTVPKPE